MNIPGNHLSRNISLLFKKLLGRLLVSSEERVVPTQRRKAFIEWVESHRDLDLPLLGDEAISRESMKGERG
ncbi:MAG: hypothetical protein WA919_12265 [Coleofasciculaceae cyanobacterium]